MITYYKVHARGGKVGAGTKGGSAKTIDEARAQFRYWRQAGAYAVRVIRYDVVAGCDTERTIIFDGPCRR